ncbi:hypothetical protein SAMN05216389_10954 [Oceanobacillus limi]|uniref:Uncharacterized protein n=1 Tax=Oceanobacillus limi TaxID=930131 RepID=A0A1I0DN34_9BACI|nr:hypothetical protein [Oceanobacillus limi]SET33919.1 hypothetical protein SAMN05216389_10954 [Oceanobacillus limi]
MMEFLYFPEDKSEYIPAIITLIVFVAAAGVAMYMITKKSKKEENRFEEEYKQLKNEYKE